MTRRHLARADAVAHTPAEDLTPCPGRCNAAYRRAQAEFLELLAQVFARMNCRASHRDLSDSPQFRH